MKTVSTSVRMNPEMTVPHSESNGFFMIYIALEVNMRMSRIYNSPIFSRIGPVGQALNTLSSTFNDSALNKSGVTQSFSTQSAGFIWISYGF